MSLDLETSKDKIEELLNLHVNTRDHLESLATISKNSSGVIQGLRGTGKTHLMLLARHRINTKILTSKNLCIYINLKRIDFPNDITQDTYNRIFSAFLYDSILSQLIIELKSNSPKGLIEKLKAVTDKEKKDFLHGLQNGISEVSRAAQSALRGTDSIEIVREYTRKISAQHTTSVDEIKKAAAKIGISSADFNVNAQYKETGSKANNSEAQGDSLRFFDSSTIHATLKSLVCQLNLTSITFYIDEWEKYTISLTHKNGQQN